MKEALKTYDKLVELLHLLDERLSEMYGGNFTVIIQAVGGFALMFHGLRAENPLSKDIDSLTELPSNVYKMAQDLDPSGWLNDDVSVDYGLPEKMKEALVFVDSPHNFKCIKLQVAVLESLMAMKLYAIDNMLRRGYDKHTNPRIQDPADVKEILRLYDIKNEQDFMREFPGLDCYTEEVYPADGDGGSSKVNIFVKYGLFE